MKNNSIALNLALAISAVGLAAALPAAAQTAPALRLTDGTNTVTVDANNTVTMSPAGCCVTTSSSGVASHPGAVAWAGTIGGFTVASAYGNAQNGAFTDPDLGVLASYSGAGTSTLTISWTATGYTGAATIQPYAQTIINNGSVVYSYYLDPLNNAFGEGLGTLVGALSNITSTVAGPIWPVLGGLLPYSVTEVEAITMSDGASFNGDNESGLIPQTLVVSCAIASGSLSTPYSSAVTASGGTAPYAYSLSAGALAPGLTLNADGTVTGTPTTPGTYSYTVQITDSTGQPALSVCGQTIALGGGGAQGGGSSLTLSCPSGLSLTQGAYYSSSFVATGGTGKDAFSISGGSLPKGLKYSASTGAVYGTPTSTGTFSFTGSVTDSSTPTKQTAKSSACTGTIAPKPAPLALTCATNKGTVGTAYNSAVVATGGTAPYSGFKLTGGSLPSGLTLNADGTITGTPTKAGTYSYTVQVVDANGAKASDGSGSGRCSSSGCSITIAASAPVTAPTLKCPTSAASVGASYSSAATVTGGTAPFTFSVSAGSLPKGLTLNTSTGAITGTPTVSGTSNFTLKVKDANGKTDDTSDCSGGCSIKVAQSITVTCPTGSATTGQSYSSTPSAKGGTAPYTWSISGGSLPNGLSLNKWTGAITGTPTRSGTYSVTLKVTDKNGLVGVTTASSSSNNNNWGSGWGWWEDDDSSDNNSNCTITVSDPNSYGNNSGWGWGW